MPSARCSICKQKSPGGCKYEVHPTNCTKPWADILSCYTSDVSNFPLDSPIDVKTRFHIKIRDGVNLQQASRIANKYVSHPFVTECVAFEDAHYRKLIRCVIEVPWSSDPIVDIAVLGSEIKTSIERDVDKVAQFVSVRMLVDGDE